MPAILTAHLFDRSATAAIIRRMVVRAKTAERSRAVRLGPPVIGLYLVTGLRRSYIIAKILQLAGCRVVVRCEFSRADLADSSNPYFDELQYSVPFYADDEIDLLSHVSEAPPVDALLFEICRTPLRHPDELRQWIANSPRAAAWNSEWHASGIIANLRSELSVLGRYWPFLPRARTVVMAMGGTSLRPTRIFSRVRRQVLTAHPVFLSDPQLRREMYESDWPSDGVRTNYLVFSGAATTAAIRPKLSSQIPELFEGRPDVRFVGREQLSDSLATAESAGQKRILWLPAWPGQQQAIAAAQWSDVLRDSHFCLCPPGMELRTHRVIEALLQGSIPILDCPNEYDIGLIDGVNCVIVRHDNWKKAIERALSYSDSERVAMRRAIADLVRLHLTYQAAATRWLQCLGVERSL